MWVSHQDGDVTTTVWVNPNGDMFWSLVFLFGGLWLTWQAISRGIVVGIVVGAVLVCFGALGAWRARRLIIRSERTHDAALRN